MQQRKEVLDKIRKQCARAFSTDAVAQGLEVTSGRRAGGRRSVVACAGRKIKYFSAKGGKTCAGVLIKLGFDE
jgi:hypothetical protein